MGEMPILLKWKFLLNEKGGKENEQMTPNLCSAQALKLNIKQIKMKVRGIFKPRSKNIYRSIQV